MTPEDSYRATVRDLQTIAQRVMQLPTQFLILNGHHLGPGLLRRAPSSRPALMQLRRRSVRVLSGLRQLVMRCLNLRVASCFGRLRCGKLVLGRLHLWADVHGDLQRETAPIIWRRSRVVSQQLARSSAEQQPELSQPRSNEALIRAVQAALRDGAGVSASDSQPQEGLTA